MELISEWPSTDVEKTVASLRNDYEYQALIIGHTVTLTMLLIVDDYQFGKFNSFISMALISNCRQ